MRAHDGKFPSSYLGYPLDEVLAEIDMTLEQFHGVCDRFTNKKLFVCDRHGQPVHDAGGNLVKVNYDNVPG